MSMEGVGTLASVYIRLDAYILHVPCRLLSWDKGRIQVTVQPKLAGSNMEEELTQTSLQNTLCIH